MDSSARAEAEGSRAPRSGLGIACWSMARRREKTLESEGLGARESAGFLSDVAEGRLGRDFGDGVSGLERK